MKENGSSGREREGKRLRESLEGIENRGSERDRERERERVGRD